MSVDKERLSISEKNHILREVQAGNINVVQEFKKNFPNLHWCELHYQKNGDTILHITSRLGFVDMVEYLLLNYTPNAVDCTNCDNKTPLHEAAQFAQYNVLKVLIKHGATVNAIKRADWTPLMLACTKVTSDSVSDNNFRCVGLLLQKGALVNYVNKDGWSALHLISREGGLKIFYLLVEHGLDVFKTTKNGRTALHIACLHGHLNIVKALTSVGLDVNLKDSSGNTPLHEAVLGGNIDICNYVLSKHVNADWSAVNNTGFGVLHLAASTGNKDLIEFLIKKLELNINLPSRTNLTPLHCAARKKQIDVVNFLISLGADAYFRDNFGRCAADYVSY
ncbi:hypothetical protein ILUMI_18847 [Ignelater luminosus]|uniref:Ankyrin repeat domain-containing protein 16 n=1 Tax=Ignelater luminosus TaxID=2038154 RepID=A0A8K0G655_IGNLU|nr:hypothetical protein ILUMI_18847 [Ignelater luminosus]